LAYHSREKKLHQPRLSWIWKGRRTQEGNMGFVSEWISVEKEFPKSPWHTVLVTDGDVVCLANYIEKPEEWYGEELVEWDDRLRQEVPLDKEWHDPHWKFEELGPFIGNDSCFANMGDIIYWMNIPLPPSKDGV